MLFDISKQILHGLSPEKYIELMEYQSFKCCLSGIEFKYDKNEEIHRGDDRLKLNDVEQELKDIIKKKLNFGIARKL